MGKLAREFKQCLKPIYIEEVFDVGVFRPLAFLLVKAAYPFPISPNQITITGILAALLGAYFLAQGTPIGFALGGICYLIAVVFDCADGMLARLKGNGTKVGRIIDGVFDYIATTAVMVGFGLGLLKANLLLPIHPAVITTIAGVSAILQSITVDYAKNQFVAHGLDNGRPIIDEVEAFEEELARLNALGGHLSERLLIRIYLGYLWLQARSKKPDQITYEREDYFRKNKIPVRLWTLIGPGTHRAMLILAALLFQPMIYFVFSIVVGNVSMLSLLIMQSFIKRGLKRRPIRSRVTAGRKRSSAQAAG